MEHRKPGFVDETPTAVQAMAAAEAEAKKEFAARDLEARVQRLEAKIADIGTYLSHMKM